MPDTISEDSLQSINESDLMQPPAKSFTGQLADYAFSTGAPAHILKAFGQGVENGWGDKNGYEFTDHTMEALQKMEGVSPGADYKGVRERLIKSANEAFIRPLIGSGERLVRTIGGAGAGVASALSQTGGEVQQAARSIDTQAHPLSGQVVKTLLGGTGEVTSGLGEGFIPEGVTGVPYHDPEAIAKARANAAIGENEGTYFGTKEPTPEQTQARNEAIGSLTPEPPPAKTVHDIARELSPEVMQQYDIATGYRNYHRNELEKAREGLQDNPRIQELNDRISGIWSKVNNVEDRLTDAARERLRQAQAELEVTPRKIATPEFEELQKKVLEADNKLRDMAPDVTRAYRMAQDQMPQEKAPTAPTEGVQAETGKSDTQVAPEDETAQKASADAVRKITSDVKKKLINAGRPEEEANLAARLIASRYITRAKLLKKDPYHLFNEEFPTVKKGGRANLDKEAANTLYQSTKTNKPLVVARRMPDGTIRYGKVGDLHPELYHNDEFTDNPFANYNKETGFAEGEGQPFLTREEAKNLVKERLGLEDKDFLSGDLEASNYNHVRAKTDALNKLPENNSFLEKLLRVFNQDPLDHANDEAGVPYLKSQQYLKKQAELQAIIDKAQNKKDLLTHANSSRQAVLDASRELRYAKQALEDFQHKATSEAYGYTLGQTKRGSLTIGNARNTIRLFKDADASTFIHESGHQFLEELMEDAKAEGVHPQVPKDAQIVRDWLGVKDGEEIPRRAHEKFARGFERYMMEGTAPSQGLADVFARFKQWLTEIYKTVAKLRSPINDEIRGVFDRLLATPEDEAGTVIAPERPEVDDTTLRVGSEAPDTFERKTVDPAIDKTQSGPVIADAGKEDAKQASTDTQGLTPVPGKFVDKAGNIRLDLINSPEDITQAIRDVSTWDDNHLAARRGNWTQRDIIELADSAGLGADEVNLKKMRALSLQDNIPLASRIYGLRKMLVSSAQHLIQMMNDGDGIGYAEAVSRHLKIQETVAGVTAEWGRAGTAFKTMAEEAEKAQRLSEFFQSQLGRTFDQVQAEMRRGRFLETPGQVSKFVKDNAKPSLGEMGQEWFINSFLSGLITHTSYLVSNKVLALWHAFPETIARATVGLVHETLLGRPIERVRFGESLEALKALGGEYTLLYGSRNGLKAAWKSMKAGQTVGLPGEGSIYDLAYKRARDSGLTGKELEESARNIAYHYATDYAYKKALDEGLTETVEIQARAEQIRSDPKIGQTVLDEKQTTPFTRTKNIPGALGQVVRSPSERMVAPIHSFDRTANYEMIKAQLLYRQVVSEGKTGKAFSDRLAYLHNNVPDLISAKARDGATELTLMGRSGDLTKRMQQLVHYEVNFPASIPIPGTNKSVPFVGRIQPIGYISPFVHVFSTIAKQATIERGPIGLLAPSELRNLSGKNGTFAQDTSIAKIGLGTAFAGAIAGLVLDKTINPPASSDPNDYHKNLVNQRVYGLPNSVRIGNMTYDYTKLGVLGFMIRNGVVFTQAVQTGLDKDEGFAPAAYQLVHGIGENFTEEGTMNSFSDLLEAIEGTEKKQDAYVSNMILSGVVPFSTGWSQIAHQVDPHQRVTEGFWQQLEARIPYMSEDLQEKVDVWGNPVPNKEFLGVYAQQVKDDPLDKALIEVGYYPAPVNKKINGIPLTQEQYHKYAVAAGQQARRLIEPYISSPGWASLSPMIKHDLVSKSVASARSIAAASVMGDPAYQELLKQATDNLYSISTNGEPN